MSALKRRISIALATYNGGNYIRSQLDSFASQTTLPDELIVSDDRSTDSTLEIVEEFRKTAPFSVKVFVNERNLGYTQNFSRAFQNCTGDIVFLSDQDDVWHKNKIERILREFDGENRPELVIHDLMICDASLHPRGQTKMGFLENLGFDVERHFVTGMAIAIRLEFLKLCAPVPAEPKMTHDLWISECARLIGKKTIVREVLADYRRHHQTVTGLLEPEPAIPMQILFLNKLQSLVKRIFKRPVIQIQGISPQLNWLINCRDALLAGNHISSSEIDGIIHRYLSELEFNNRRAAVINQNRFERVPEILSLYRSGAYRYSSGWKSALKDLFAR